MKNLDGKLKKPSWEIESEKNNYIGDQNVDGEAKKIDNAYFGEESLTKKAFERFKEKFECILGEEYTDAEFEDFIRTELNNQRDEIDKMLWSSFPSDMENLSTMTENQAYRVLKSFIEKLK